MAKARTKPRTKRPRSPAKRRTSAKRESRKRPSPGPRPRNTQGQYTALGYRAVTVAHRNGRAYIGGSADYHLRYDRDELLKQSRAFDRDNVLYDAILSRFCDNVLGPGGFKLQARVGGINPNRTERRVNDLIERELWPEFTWAPEVRGLVNWRGLEDLALRELAAAGDLGFITLRSRGQLQALEAEQIATQAKSAPGKDGNRIEQGVELDRLGRPVAFYAASVNAQNGMVQAGGATRIPASDFIFVRGQVKRLTQTRGVPALVPSFPMLHRLRDIFDSEAQAWLLLSKFALMITRENAAGFGEDFGADDDSANTADGDITDRIHNIAEGIIFNGKAGESIAGINQNRPPKSFGDTVYTFLRLLCLPLGMPVEVFLSDYAKMNFSSARAALTQYYRVCRLWQRRLINQLHERVYRWRVGAWLAQGRFPKGFESRPDLYAHEWQPSPLPWLDVEKEARAQGVLLDRGLATYADICRANDQDADTIRQTRIAEIRAAVEAARQVEADTGERVPWQIFAGHELGKTEAAARAKAETADPEPEPKPEPEPEPVGD